MSFLDRFFFVPRPADVGALATEPSVGNFISEASLSFSGMATAGGVILALVQSASGDTGTNWTAAVIIAVVIGLFLMTIGFWKAKKTNADGLALFTGVGIGVFNTALLLAAMVGIGNTFS